MNFSDRISNQTTIYYSQGRYNRQQSRRLSSPNVRSPKNLKKGKESTKEWVARTFSSEPLCANRNSCSTFTNLKPSAPTVHDQANASKDGKPAIFFQQSLVDSINDEKFKFCLVGKFLRWRPSLSQIRDWVSTTWKLKGQWSITLLDHRHVFIRLDNESDMLHVWTRSRWFIGGYTMRVFKWFPTFIPSNGEPSSAAIWVSLPSLPVAFFQEELLYPIASLAGKVFAMDVPTRKLSRTNVARVCVEVDLLKELPRQVWVGVGEGGFWQDICYERLPSYCSDCREQGHSTEGCQANGSDWQNRTRNSKTRFKSQNTGICNDRCPKEFLCQSKRARIYRIVEEGSRQPMRLGSSLSSLMNDDVEEVAKCKAEIPSEVSPRVYISGESGTTTAECLKAESSKQVSARKNSNRISKAIDVPEAVSSSRAAVGRYWEKKRECSDQIERKSPPERKRVYSRIPILFWKNKQKELIPLDLRPPSLTEYKFSEIKKMTKSFRDRIGEGGFGIVFKGKLPDGQKVAAKVFKEREFMGDKDFFNEMQILSVICHVNVIRLLGFCSEGSKRVLVYVFVSNGSLDRLIYSKESTAKPKKAPLCRIAIDVARGFEYLHHTCDPPLLHLDLKPANVLLDDDLRPKICDFGLARRWDFSGCISIRGTRGYIAPEYCASGKVSTRTDVYSYGLILLEMALKRRLIDPYQENSKHIDLRDWVHSDVTSRGRIPGVALEETERKMIIVGIWCTQEDATARPSFSEVVDMLEANINDLCLPQNFLSGNVLGINGE